MAQYPKTGSIGSIGSIILAILEVQVLLHEGLCEALGSRKRQLVLRGRALRWAWRLHTRSCLDGEARALTLRVHAVLEYTDPWADATSRSMSGFFNLHHRGTGGPDLGDPRRSGDANYSGASG